MDVWIVWLLLAAVLGVAELFTLSAALGLLGGAAVVTAGAAALGAPVPVQLLVFAAGVGGGDLAGAARRPAPPAQPRRHSGSASTRWSGGRRRSSARSAASGGTVRIDGEEWSARPCDPHDPAYVIPAGATVSVMAIRGATALVYPQE